MLLTTLIGAVASHPQVLTYNGLHAIPAQMLSLHMLPTLLLWPTPLLPLRWPTLLVLLLWRTLLLPLLWATPLPLLLCPPQLLQWPTLHQAPLLMPPGTNWNPLTNQLSSTDTRLCIKSQFYSLKKFRLFFTGIFSSGLHKEKFLGKKAKIFQHFAQKKEKFSTHPPSLWFLLFWMASSDFSCDSCTE